MKKDNNPATVKANKKQPYPSWVCFKCGKRHGKRIPSVATWHHGKCDVCGKPKCVTEPRDFGHLKTVESNQ